MHDHLDDYKIILNIIMTVPYAVIATTGKNGDPWNTPVHVAIDDQFNFYWASTKDSVHSLNIQGNNNVFIVIFDSSDALYKGKGLYARGIAREITDHAELEFSKKCMRKTLSSEKLACSFKPFKSKRKMYIAEPTQIWINDAVFTDEGRLVKDFRRQVDIEKLIKYKNTASLNLNT